MCVVRGRKEVDETETSVRMRDQSQETLVPLKDFIVRRNLFTVKHLRGKPGQMDVSMSIQAPFVFFS